MLRLSGQTLRLNEAYGRLMSRFIGTGFRAAAGEAHDRAHVTYRPTPRVFRVEVPLMSCISNSLGAALQ